jgi:transposase, IS5 family
MQKYQKIKNRQCKSRAALEPAIGHIKSDHRILGNYLKGVLGDKINAILAGAAFNFRKALNQFKAFCLILFSKIGAILNIFIVNYQPKIKILNFRGTTI